MGISKLGKSVFNSYAQSMQWSSKMLVVIKQAADSSSLSKLVCALSINLVNIFSGMPSSSLKVGYPPLLCFSLWVQASGSRLRESLSDASFPRASCKILEKSLKNFYHLLTFPPALIYSEIVNNANIWNYYLLVTTKLPS